MRRDKQIKLYVQTMQCYYKAILKLLMKKIKTQD